MSDVPFYEVTRNFTYRDFSIAGRTGYETASATLLGVADFNNDGRPDVLIAYLLYPLEDRAVPIQVLLGDGAGDFTLGTSTIFGTNVPSTTHPRDLVIGDFNRDGRSDLFIADHGYDTGTYPGFRNTLMLSSGATGYVNATSNLPSTPDFSHSAAGGDIDGDGDLDILVGNTSGGSLDVYFLLGDGRGGFQQSFGRLPTAVEQRNPEDKFLSAAMLDGDGDGDLDLFLGTHGSNGDTTSVILRNDGTGRFLETLATIQSGGTAGGAQYLAVDTVAADIDGDGRTDLIVDYQVDQGGTQTTRLQLLMNRASGFVDETASRMSDPTNTINWVVSTQWIDMNGDGWNDIFLSNQSDTPLFLNDGTGHFVRMPAGVMPGNRYDHNYAADFNGDGRMDIFSSRGTTLNSIRLGKDPGLTQTGGASADGFMGDGDAETFNGEAGDDVIFGGAGADTAMGGAGADTIVGGAGAGFLRGEDGNDYIQGGAAFDDAHGNMGDDTVRGGVGDDWVVGGKDQDQLFGDAGLDIVLGNLGNDTCYGGADRDVVRGGQGNDVIYGEAGSDYVSGDRGDDTVYGGAGADWFHGSQDQGVDRIMDFSIAEGDRILLDPGTVYTVDQSGADIVINMGGGNYMLLVGVQLSTLGPASSWIVESYAWG